MLLGAGMGRRLLPLSWTVPKPALPVLGRPIGVEILHRLYRFGFDETVVNLHHLPDAVRAVLAEPNAGYLPRVRFTHEPIILGTGGGIGNAAPLLRGAGPVLVHNCDFLSDIDLAALLTAHRASGMLATLVLIDPRPGYSKVEIDAAGRIVSLAGKPEVDPGRVASSHVFTGCHVIDERVLDLIPVGRPSSIVSDVYVDLAARGQLGSFVHRGFWWEFGTPEQYLEGSLRLFDLPAERLGHMTSHDPIRRIGNGVVSLGAGATVQDDVEIEGRLALGLASLVGRGARLRDSVVLGETWIGPNARLDRVIVGPGVEIPAGFRGHRALIARVRPGAGEAIAGMRRDGELAILELEQPRSAIE
jgi:mannose-1-phosphate guanylyltransferase